MKRLTKVVHKRGRIWAFGERFSVTLAEQWDTWGLRTTDKWHEVTCKKCLACRKAGEEG